jgi:membrane protein DedA with SNARE-associated domain
MPETTEIINQIGALSYLGVFGLAIISNVIVPIPEEGVLLILGYLASGKHLNIFLVLPITFVGLFISDIGMYWLSRGGNKIVNGVYNRLFAKRLESRKEWLEKHLNKVIFFSRFFMQLRFLGPFLAGQMKVPFTKFLYINFFALILYTPLYLFLGWYFRAKIDSIVSGVNVLKNIIVIFIISLVFISLLKLAYNSFLGKTFSFFKKKIQDM